MFHSLKLAQVSKESNQHLFWVAQRRGPQQARLWLAGVEGFSAAITALFFQRLIAAEVTDSTFFRSLFRNAESPWKPERLQALPSDRVVFPRVRAHIDQREPRSLAHGLDGSDALVALRADLDLDRISASAVAAGNRF